MYTLFQRAPTPELNQIWCGYDAAPNFHRRWVEVVSIIDDEIEVLFLDSVKKSTPNEYYKYPKTMFSNIITGLCYIRTRKITT